MIQKKKKKKKKKKRENECFFDDDDVSSRSKERRETSQTWRTSFIDDDLRKDLCDTKFSASLSVF